MQKEITVSCAPLPSPVWLLTADEFCSFSDSVIDALASLTGSAFPARCIPTEGVMRGSADGSRGVENGIIAAMHVS